MVNDRGVPTLLVYPEMANGAWADEDWGSAGPACIFPLGICVAAGKDGIAYPIKTSKSRQHDCRESCESKIELWKACSAAGMADYESWTGGPLSDRSSYLEFLSMGRDCTSPHDPRAVP